MSLLAANASPTFNDIDDADIAAKKVLTDDAISKISNNAKFGAVRCETFFLGYFTHGVTVGQYAPSAPIISPFDSYEYDSSEIIYDWELYSTRAAGSPFTDGQLTPPPISSLQPGNIFGWRANITSAGVVDIDIHYDGTTTPTHDGILKVFAHCQRTMTLAEEPDFTDVPESRLMLEQPLRVSDIQGISHNAKFGAVRTEIFDMGFWAGGATVGTPTSPIDSYAYSRDEIRYKLIFYSTFRPNSFSNGTMTPPTFGSSGILRRTGNGPLYFTIADLIDSSGLINTSIGYYIQDGASHIYNGDGVYRVLAIAQRQSTQTVFGASTASGSETGSGKGGGVVTQGSAADGLNPGGVNAQTGTSYTLVDTDRGKLITFNNASPVAVTLDDTFVDVFGAFVENIGAGAVTLTPASGTINGAASLVLTTGQGCVLFFDGTNWLAETGIGGSSSSAGAVVEAKTNGVGAPYSVSATTDLGKTFTNEGASAEVYFALPTAATSVGPYTFICQDSDLLRIVANTGDTIRLYDNVSASAGYIKAVAIGAAVRLVAINATEWMAEAVVGEWDVN